MKNLKRFLLAAFLIFAGLAALHANFPYLDVLVGITGIVAGALHLLQK